MRPLRESLRQNKPEHWRNESTNPSRGDIVSSTHPSLSFSFLARTSSKANDMDKSENDVITYDTIDTIEEAFAVEISPRPLTPTVEEKERAY
ncbi:hypothetical protein AVEN_188208-1 [Araneus ventricosus]|uniref:Uncharacterized protein n=1 Tax=Araneus ventricosus TaxID=182803 RepID=A0A4Y2HYR6_ARAVE|nr:hypothetical protein AVEN_188208-1 [Araneus ventricosus]